MGRQKIKGYIRTVLLIIPHSLYLRIAYVVTFKKILHLHNPRTFTEKIQRIKIHQKGQLYSDLADKYAVRAYVAEKIAENILIPLYRHGTDPECIPFADLPNTYVIKCNHGSKYNIIVHDATNLDITATKAKLRQWLATDFWKIGRELQYKGIKKHIIIEALLEDAIMHTPRDYKFFCFHGKATYIQVNSERFTNHTVDFFDTQRQHQAFGILNNWSIIPIPKPDNLEKMIEYAEKLSDWFPLMRVDLYTVNGKIYFWELTLTPHSWFEPFTPDHAPIDRMLGAQFSVTAA